MTKRSLKAAAGRGTNRLVRPSRPPVPEQAAQPQAAAGGLGCFEWLSLLASIAAVLYLGIIVLARHFEWLQFHLNASLTGTLAAVGLGLLLTGAALQFYLTYILA